jgi:flagellar FliL protein
MADEARAKEEEKKDAKPAEAGAEGAPAEGDEAAAAAKAKKRKLLMLASIALAVVGCGVAVGVVFFMGEDKAHEEPQEEAGLEVAVVDVPEFTVNLLSEDENTGHFMKIKLAVELARKTDVESVNLLLPRLQDDWNTFLRQLRPGDMQGSAALQRLKEGLMRRAIQSLAPVPVKAVYIRELLVQ